MTPFAPETDASAAGEPRDVVLALDPGKNLGAAWVGFDGRVERRAILRAVDLERLAVAPATVVLIGNGTGSRALAERLRRRGLAPVLVDETNTTLAARKLYFRDHPPRGLMRLLPPGMRSPPRAIDDYAAEVIALRWLAARGRAASAG